MTDTLRGRLARSFTTHVDRPAVWSVTETATYAELHDRARAFAAALDRNIASDGVVGIYAQHDLDSLVGIIGTVLSGRGYLPLNPTFPETRHAAICAQEPPAAILCSARHDKKARALVATLGSNQILMNCAGDVLARGDAAPQSRPDRDPRTVYAMFTSGTTGTPKGVRILESNLLAYLDGIAPIANLTSQDRTTHFFDLSFDLSVHDIFVTLMAGAEINILPPKQKLAIADFIADRQITKWFSVPSLGSFCVRLGQLTPGRLSTLRTALFCGEALPVKLAEIFADAAPDAGIFNLYGPTEATIAFMVQEYRAGQDMKGESVVPLGQPIGDQVVAIAGDAAEGELLLGGSQVTPGYIDNPGQTGARFFIGADGTPFYRSGDVVVRDADFGYLFRGRIDDQIKINGYRIELLEIDRVLREVTGCAEVSAIAWPPAHTGQSDHIVAFVTEPGLEIAEVIAGCRARLPVYMVPRRIVTLDAMPVTVSGKINRKALAALIPDD